VGVDRSADVLKSAQQRASSLGHAQVTFLQGDLGTVVPEGAFDALVGRLVLAHVADPVAVLHHLAGLVRPGGVVAFHELDLAARAWPPAPIFEQCVEWVTRASERAGSKSNMGMRLHKTFVDAGLPGPQVRIRGIASDGGDWEYVQLIAELVRSLLPTIERFQVASAAEVAIETLAERLRDEVVAGGGIIYTSLHYGAWTRTPSA
jgi:SAM-dependent methyltransferase